MANLGARFADEAALISEIRDRVGYASEEDSVLVSDTRVRSVIQSALDVLNQEMPLEGIGSFLTVVDQQEYSPLQDEEYRILKVYWGKDAGGGICTKSGVYRELDSAFSPFVARTHFGLPVYHDMATIQIYIDRLNRFEEMFGMDNLILDDGRVFLNPVPSIAGDSVYYTYYGTRFSTWQEVGDQMYIRLFFLACEWLLHERIASGPGAIVSVSDGPANTRIQTDAYKAHLEVSERKKKEFFQRVSTFSGIFR